MPLARILLATLQITVLWLPSMLSLAAQVSVASNGNVEVMWVTCAASPSDAMLRIQHSGSTSDETIVLSRNNRLIHHLLFLSGIGVADPCGHDNWRNFPSAIIRPLVDSLGQRGALAAWKSGSTLFILVQDADGLMLFVADNSRVYTPQYLIVAERPFALHFTETRWQEVRNLGGSLRAFGEAGYLVESGGKLVLKRYVESSSRAFIGNPSDPVMPPTWYNASSPIRFPSTALPLELLVSTAVLSPEARESASGVAPTTMAALPLPQNPIVILPSNP